MSSTTLSGTTTAGYAKLLLDSGGSGNINGSTIGWEVLLHGDAYNISGNTFNRINSACITYDGPGAIKINYNNFIANASTFGIKNLTTSTINALNNFWGNKTGPTHSSNSAGTGAAISDYVDYSTWYASKLFWFQFNLANVGSNAASGYAAWNDINITTGNVDVGWHVLSSTTRGYLEFNLNGSAFNPAKHYVEKTILNLKVSDSAGTSSDFRFKDITDSWDANALIFNTGPVLWNEIDASSIEIGTHAGFSTEWQQVDLASASVLSRIGSKLDIGIKENGDNDDEVILFCLSRKWTMQPSELMDIRMPRIGLSSRMPAASCFSVVHGWL